ncbi:MAG: DUF5522 domain-containing protein [Ktedonobacteraceae bacterium]
MSLPTDGPDAEADWEITPEGLYIATRHFLLQRGYCCANRCRNCPYINWCDNPAWQHAPATAIQHARVSPKALVGAREQLARHEHEVAEADRSEQTEHQELIEHYRLLLEHWR